MANSNLNGFKASYLGLSVCVALSFSHHSVALGLGDLAEKSVIGEPLRATLAITGEEQFPLKTLSVRRISAAEAASMGIELLPFELPVSFEVRQEEGRRWVVMSSQQAVSKPYMEFLLELSWPKGSMVREFVILPSSPSESGFKTTPAPSKSPKNQTASTNSVPTTRNNSSVERQIDQSSPIATPSGKLSQYRTLASNTVAQTEPQPQQIEPKPKKSANKTDDSTYTRFSFVPTSYVIQPGDILSRVARDWGRSTGQSSARLTRKVTRWVVKNNPHIFDGQTIDRLIVGERLAFPTPNDMGLNLQGTQPHPSKARTEDAHLVTVSQALPPKAKETVAAPVSTKPSEPATKPPESATQTLKNGAAARDKPSPRDAASPKTRPEMTEGEDSSKELLSFMGQRINELVASNNRHEERWLKLHKLPLHPAIEAYSQQSPEKALALREAYEKILSDAFDQTLEMNVDTFDRKALLQVSNTVSEAITSPTKASMTGASTQAVAASTLKKPTDIDPTTEAVAQQSADAGVTMFGLSTLTVLQNIIVSLIGFLAFLAVFFTFRRLRKGSVDTASQEEPNAQDDTQYVAKAAVELETPEWHDPLLPQVEQTSDEVEEQLANFVDHFDNDFSMDDRTTAPEMPTDTTQNSDTTQDITLDTPHEQVSPAEPPLPEAFTTTPENTASSSDTPPTESLASDLDLQLDVDLINQLIHDDFEGNNETHNTVTEDDRDILSKSLLDTHDFSTDLEQAPLVTDTVDKNAPSDHDMALLGSDLGADTLPFGDDFLNMDDDIGGSDKVASLISDIELYIEIGQLDKARDLMKEMAQIDDDPRVTAAFEEFGSVLNF